MTVVGPAGSTLSQVSTVDPTTVTTPPPSGITLPLGLVSFVLQGVTPGSSPTVSVFTGPTTGINAYAKYDAGTATWSVLPTSRVQVFDDRVDITLTDGGEGDDDGVPNGSVTDPGGIATSTASADATPPVVTGTPTRSPNSKGWYSGDVRIRWTAVDPGSGIAAQPADTVVTTQGAHVSAQSPLVCDLAPTPNCAHGQINDLHIDRTAPTLTVRGVANGATYTLGAVPTASCTASDGLSGLNAPCSGVLAGGNANRVGLFTYATSVVDKAGNRRTVSASYRVVYRFDGFMSPLNDPAVTPGVAMSVFRTGSTAPVGITVKRANGQAVTPLSKPVWVTTLRRAHTTLPVNEPSSSAKGTSGTTFTWKTNHWQYHWSTKGLAAGYLYRIGVRLDDGTTHYLNVGVR